MSNPIGNSRFSHCRDRIASSNYNNCPSICCLCDRLGYANCSLIERWFLKDAHRSVPNHHPCISKSCSKVGDCLNSNVHADQTNVCKLDRNSLRNYLLSLHGLIAIDNLMISRKQESNSLLFSSLFDLERGLQHVVFNQRLANSKTFCFEEGVSHCAADQNLINATIDQCVDYRDLV